MTPGDGGRIQVGDDERLHVLDPFNLLLVKRAGPGPDGIRQELEHARKLINERLGKK